MVVVGDQNPVPITHQNLSYKQTDVTSWSSLLALFNHAVATNKRIDHVFANAGIGGGSDYLSETFDPETHELCEPSSPTLDINLKGMINTAYLGLYHLRNPPEGLSIEEKTRGGSIVCTASAASFQRFSSPDYAVSKHGILGFMRGIAPLLIEEQSPIRINCIAPSWTRTGIVPATILERVGVRVQEPEIPARSVALLMADHRRQGQFVYSAQGRFSEVEEEKFLPLALEVVGAPGDEAVLAAGRKLRREPLESTKAGDK